MNGLDRPRIPNALALAITLVFAACGNSAGANTTTSNSQADTTTVAPATTAGLSSSTAAPDTTNTAAPGDLPTVLRTGTYLVGTEIRTGIWTPDECGCVWAWVAEDGSQTAGTSEDAEVRDNDHAVMLGPCNWALSG
jgi:hypothetical protein